MQHISKWMVDNEEYLGKYFIISLVGLSQGVLALSEVPLNFLFKDDFHMSPAQVTIAQGIIYSPWIFKPLYGLLSDSLPIFGERRKSYLIIFSFIHFLGWLALAFLVKEKTAGIMIILGIQFCAAFCNVIGEAIIVEISQLKTKALQMNEEEQQAEASKNISIFWGSRNIGTLATVFLGGYLIQIIDKHYVFAITGIFPLILFLTSFVMSGDSKEEEIIISNLSDQNLTKVQLFFRFLKKPQIYQPIIFVLLFTMAPSTGSSMFFFQTERLGFQPDFIGTLKFIGSAGSLIGVIVYNQFLKNIKFSSIFIFTSISCSCLGLSQLLLVTRLNVSMGIPDKWFCLGGTVIMDIASEINLLPILVLACRLCPKKIEATMFSVVMSTLNLGGFLSQSSGAMLIHYLGITQTNFENLWKLIVITSILSIVPLVGINLVSQDGKKQLSDSDLTTPENSETKSNNHEDDEDDGHQEISIKGEGEEIDALIGQNGQIKGNKQEYSTFEKDKESSSKDSLENHKKEEETISTNPHTPIQNNKEPSPQKQSMESKN